MAHISIGECHSKVTNFSSLKAGGNGPRSFIHEVDDILEEDHQVLWTSPDALMQCLEPSRKQSAVGNPQMGPGWWTVVRMEVF